MRERGREGGPDMAPAPGLDPLATGGKAIRTRSSVETGKKRGPQGRAAKQGRKRKAGVVIKGN